MSATKSIIEQADEIVGIAEDLSANWITRAFSPDTYRRGAYVEWMPKQKGFHGLDAPAATDSLEKLAAHIVELRAASNPKGDGLPEVVGWSVDVDTDELILKCSGGPDGPSGFGEFIDLYLAKRDSPVRRLLAAFEVVDKRPTHIGCFAFGHLNGEPVMISGPNGRPFPIPESDVYFWLVPKAVRP